MSRRATRFAQRWLEDVTDALWPGACRHCGAVLPAVASKPPRAARPYAALPAGAIRRRLLGSWSLPLWLLCTPCSATLRRASGGSALPGLAIPCVTAFVPGPVLFDLVHALKYEAMPELAPWLAVFLARAARRELGRDLVLVPVPLHPERRRQRGFNQSALLAAAVGARLGVPLAEALLERRRATRPQARLAASERAANVAGAFGRRGPLPAGAARLVLVDDVVTTGATAAAALAALGCPPARAAVLALCQARLEPRESLQTAGRSLPI